LSPRRFQQALAGAWCRQSAAGAPQQRRGSSCQPPSLSLSPATQTCDTSGRLDSEEVDQLSRPLPGPTSRTGSCCKHWEKAPCPVLPPNQACELAILRRPLHLEHLAQVCSRLEHWRSHFAWQSQIWCAAIATPVLRGRPAFWRHTARGSPFLRSHDVPLPQSRFAIRLVSPKQLDRSALIDEQATFRCEPR
jgi:hypothetical protein